jgi:hypothetical protein
MPSDPTAITRPALSSKKYRTSGCRPLGIISSIGFVVLVEFPAIVQQPDSIPKHPARHHFSNFALEPRPTDPPESFLPGLRAATP